MTAKLDISESLRAKWFFLYALIFGGLVVGLLAFGVTESRVMGVTGLSRLLVTFIQITMAILPIFVLLSTVRSLAGDREAGVFEYLLALPVSLGGWYWGKFLGRFIVVFLPVFGAMSGTVIWGLIMGWDIPWFHFGYYTFLLISVAACFLGIGFMTSSVARSTDVSQAVAFLTWLVMLLFLDLILLGSIIKAHAPTEAVVAIALANPLQTFRTASMMLFDPELILLGPSAYVILDSFGHVGYMAWSVAYPVILGGVMALIGFTVFRRGDLP
ncbi:ABC transporter permease [Terasakiella sp. A23]|uniref:ABC transporter permease n=1 Tax=Terasakiella sp. FCG-A23 TaxID=3080561 RepID=UPI0029535F21|nr:ABC transporter permease subunit [Terasakiella sp. A23]